MAERDERFSSTGTKRKHSSMSEVHCNEKWHVYKNGGRSTFQRERVLGKKMMVRWCLACLCAFDSDVLYVFRGQFRMEITRNTENQLRYRGNKEWSRKKNVFSIKKDTWKSLPQRFQCFLGKIISFSVMPCNGTHDHRTWIMSRQLCQCIDNRMKFPIWIAIHDIICSKCLVLQIVTHI